MTGIAKGISEAQNRSAVSQGSISTKQFKHQLDALTAGTPCRQLSMALSLSPLTVHADRQGPPVLFFGLETIQIDLIPNLDLVGQVGS